MPSESANSSPGANYWYGNNLPNGIDGLPHDATNPRMLRRASEAVINSSAFHGLGRDAACLQAQGLSAEHFSWRSTDAFQESTSWDQTIASLHLETSPPALRAQSLNPAANHKAPLAPKQGLGDALANSRSQHQSPISGTYALRTPRGKITSIACESCRKRKSKCDGVRPKCNTCQTKNLSCVYDVAEDGKTTTQLRAHVRRLAKELDDMKSIVSLLAMSPDRSTAANWATELEKNGFAHHTAEEIKKALQVRLCPSQLQHEDSLGTPGSERFQRPSQSLAASSYDGSSRDESREPSQPALAFHLPESALDSTQSFAVDPANEYSKFSFDCAFYRRTKREMLASGWDEAQIFGRNEVDVDTLILGWVDPQDGQPVPTWAARMSNKILSGLPMPVRLASAFLLTKMMRASPSKWLIWPSVENMNAMPDWLMPLAKQDCSATDLLVDLIPWPQLRQYLYQHPREFIVSAFLGRININWPYADEACHYWDVEMGCTRLTPLFENHCADLNSWTLDAKALEAMPQIEGLVPISR
ncbi:hypothetical protein K458DRAFT_296241 [Lentithecium fluviatile CBS 122367]|uniref:Zn(2)-C6 fungal-type domain-containing protein n=1 Tax=Lentithecium fluviatile CBS 122367 TaxID=1168545 RepID=A0A6G1JB75_9PLEO|nr:hypothetical protein K458DRAFT_296241 [Lentithecium fluviatile CBS 122367]